MEIENKTFFQLPEVGESKKSEKPYRTDAVRFGKPADNTGEKISAYLFFVTRTYIIYSPYKGQRDNVNHLCCFIQCSLWHYMSL